MKTRAVLTAFALAFALGACGKKKSATNANAANANRAAASRTPGPLPDAGFKAQITLPDPPAKLRAGEKARVQVHIRNASDVFWWARGGETNTRDDNKFYLAAGDRWLKGEDSETPLSQSLFTELTQRAAERNNEIAPATPAAEVVTAG